MPSDTNGRIVACAIAPNLDYFGQVIDQMQEIFSEGWGGLNLEDALPVLKSRHSEQMDHVLIALGTNDEFSVEEISAIIAAAKQRGIKVTIVAEQLDPTVLQTLMRSDADEFLPYPLPAGALRAALDKQSVEPAAIEPAPTPPAAPTPAQVENTVAETVEKPAVEAPEEPAPQTPELRKAPPVEPIAQKAPEPIPAAQPTPVVPPIMQQPAPEPVAPTPQAAPPVAPEPVVAPAAPQTPIQMVAPEAPAPAVTGKKGVILPVYGMAGGVGASTFAANLAWELQSVLAKGDGKVCLLDFGFQFGSIATYLDVGRSDVGLEFLSSSGLDAQAFTQAVPHYKNRLAVLPAPIDAVPLEVAEADEIGALLDLAASMYDYVIVDLPTALVSWSEAVLQRANLYLALGEVEMRTAQNALRFLRVLKADDLPYEKVQFIINRAPKKTDLNGRSRMKRMSDSLNVEFRWHLPDGGKQVLTACDQGAPLAEVAPRNPLRKEIRKIAENLVQLSASEEPKKARA